MPLLHQTSTVHSPTSLFTERRIIFGRPPVSETSQYYPQAAANLEADTTEQRLLREHLENKPEVLEALTNGIINPRRPGTAWEQLGQLITLAGQHAAPSVTEEARYASVYDSLFKDASSPLLSEPGFITTGGTPETIVFSTPTRGVNVDAQKTLRLKTLIKALARNEILTNSKDWLSHDTVVQQGLKSLPESHPLSNPRTWPDVLEPKHYDQLFGDTGPISLTPASGITKEKAIFGTTAAEAVVPPITEAQVKIRRMLFWKKHLLSEQARQGAQKETAEVARDFSLQEATKYIDNACKDFKRAGARGDYMTQAGYLAAVTALGCVAYSWILKPLFGGEEARKGYMDDLFSFKGLAAALGVGAGLGYVTQRQNGTYWGDGWLTSTLDQLSDQSIADALGTLGLKDSKSTKAMIKLGDTDLSALSDARNKALKDGERHIDISGVTNGKKNATKQVTDGDAFNITDTVFKEYGKRYYLLAYGREPTPGNAAEQLDGEKLFLHYYTKNQNRPTLNSVMINEAKSWEAGANPEKLRQRYGITGALGDSFMAFARGLKNPAGIPDTLGRNIDDISVALGITAQPMLKSRLSTLIRTFSTEKYNEFEATWQRINNNPTVVKLRSNNYLQIKQGTGEMMNAVFHPLGAGVQTAFNASFNIITGVVDGTTETLEKYLERVGKEFNEIPWNATKQADTLRTLSSLGIVPPTYGNVESVLNLYRGRGSASPHINATDVRQITEILKAAGITPDAIATIRESILQHAPAAYRMANADVIPYLDAQSPVRITPQMQTDFADAITQHTILIPSTVPGTPPVTPNTALTTPPIRDFLTGKTQLTKTDLTTLENLLSRATPPIDFAAKHALINSIAKNTPWQWKKGSLVDVAQLGEASLTKAWNITVEGGRFAWQLTEEGANGALLAAKSVLESVKDPVTGLPKYPVSILGTSIPQAARDVIMQTMNLHYQEFLRPGIASGVQLATIMGSITLAHALIIAQHPTEILERLTRAASKIIGLTLSGTPPWNLPWDQIIAGYPP